MKRPTAVTVFGTLNIIFALLGALTALTTVKLFAAGADTNNPVIQIIHDNATYAAWLKISIGLGLPFCGILLASGIGLLQLKPWARQASIIYAIYAILMVLIGVVINFFLIMRPLIEQAHHQQGTQAAATMGAAIGGTFGSFFGLAYPILLLIFMFRPVVVAAFASAAHRSIEV